MAGNAERHTILVVLFLNINDGNEDYNYWFPVRNALASQYLGCVRKGVARAVVLSEDLGTMSYIHTSSLPYKDRRLVYRQR
jgi:hypothetical protein